MKKLLRSKATQHFFTSDGNWTLQPARALDIGEIPHPQKLIQALNLDIESVELYYSFADEEHREVTEFDFALPLH